MILGIGTDLANIERIAGTLDRFGDRFRQRVFTPVELAKAARRQDEAGTLAKRWAAKEACSKALGTGLRMGIAWRDMAVTNLGTGQPIMHLTGWAAERLLVMTPPDHRAIIHVTLTDDHPWAQAFVLIEAVPDPRPAPAASLAELDSPPAPHHERRKRSPKEPSWPTAQPAKRAASWKPSARSSGRW